MSNSSTVGLNLSKLNGWNFPDACLVIFAKAPEPGNVKTRLIPQISAEQAASLQSRLLSETLELAHRQRLCPVQLWCSPSTEHPEFRSALKRYPISLHTQFGTDLGDRMETAIATNLERFTAVVLIGCDCPSLTQQDLADCLSALRRGNDLALAPAEDGGYALIGMKQPRPELLKNMQWGTAQVLSETRSRIAGLGLQCFETRLQWDIDRPKDLKRYLKVRASEKKIQKMRTPAD